MNLKQTAEFFCYFNYQVVSAKQGNPSFGNTLNPVIHSCKTARNCGNGVGVDKPEKCPVGIWGQRHLQYLKQHHRVVYAELLTSGKLNDYLADIDLEAEEMVSRLVKELGSIIKVGVTNRAYKNKNKKSRAYLEKIR